MNISLSEETFAGSLSFPPDEKLNWGMLHLDVPLKEIQALVGDQGARGMTLFILSINF